MEKPAYGEERCQDRLDKFLRTYPKVFENLAPNYPSPSGPSGGLARATPTPVLLCASSGQE
ncbi:hypothetical protein I79_002435 [Cricetulus griseus]|uniref:Uncharacterized protein n=1 Tax=Cricetulus griseus TaxID=10029 RepID=G3GXE5_CRIGR|nr:hypothetical protein I79_002435 [Cricetulus griseus]